MPPRKPKMPTSPESPSEEQGAFFGVNVSKVTPNGLTDAEGFTAKPGDVSYVYPEDGAYYPSEATVTQGGTETPVEQIVAKEARAKEIKRNRKIGSRGVHNARHPVTGRYEDGMWVGAVLPPLYPGGKPMIVTDTNWPESKDRARQLDARDLKREAENPTLDVAGTHDVQPVVDAIAAAHDIEQALAEDAQGSESEEPQAETTQESTAPQITSEQKLAIIQEKAGFVPATHDEKNTAIGLIFSSAEHGRYWAHAYLMETQDHLVKHYMGAEGMTYPQAKKKAAEGVVSRINEMGDYLQGAVDDGKALEWLQGKLDDTMNPSLTLEEAIMDSFEPVSLDEEERTKDGQTMLWAVAAIVRFYDYDTHQEVPFLPMTEREDRSVTMDQDGKNKQLYNPYVAAFLLTDERPEIMDKYAAISQHIVEQTKTLTVRELRALVPRALEDQRSRYGFWKQALRDMKGPYKQAAQRRLDS